MKWLTGHDGILVDDDGEPLLCFHGTSVPFDRFKPPTGCNGAQLGRGFYVATRRESARRHGPVVLEFLVRASTPIWEAEIGSILFAEGGLFYLHKARLLGFEDPADVPEDVYLDFDPDERISLQAQDDAIAELRSLMKFDAVIGHYDEGVQIMLFDAEGLVPAASYCPNATNAMAP